MTRDMYHHIYVLTELDTSLAIRNDIFNSIRDVGIAFRNIS